MTEVGAFVQSSQFQNMLLKLVAGSLCMEGRLALGDLHCDGELVHRSATSEEELKTPLPVFALPTEGEFQHSLQRKASVAVGSCLPVE
jgi:hypothetical protein